MNLAEVAHLVKDTVLQIGIEKGETSPTYIFVELTDGACERLEVPPFESSDNEEKAKAVFIVGQYYGCRKPICDC